LSSFFGVQYFLIMAAVLLLLAMMAMPATATTVPPKSTNAMSTNRPPGSSSEELIRASQGRHNRIFGVYVVLLALTVLGTYFVWNSGNKVQDAIQADANARIVEAGAKASTADERSKKLEGDNLTLGGQVATLQTAASDAKIAQQKVEIELEQQRQKTAEAEKSLLELAKKQAGRTIEKGALSSLLKGKAVGTVTIWYEPDDTEAYHFAMIIFSEFTGTGWTTHTVERIPDNASLTASLPPEARGLIPPQSFAAERQLLPISVRGGGGAGLALIAHSIQPGQPEDGAFRVLYAALLSVNKQLASRPNADLPENTFIIVVGPKP
jgi:hypothetical protein